MKVTTVIFTAVMAVASVSAAAAPVADANARNVWCYRPGQPCWKVKRTAEALAAAAAEPDLDARNIWCYRRGQPCWKAKRGLEDLSAELEHSD